MGAGAVRVAAAADPRADILRLNVVPAEDRSGTLLGKDRISSETPRSDEVAMTVSTSSSTPDRPGRRDPHAHATSQPFPYPLRRAYVEPDWTRLPGYRDVTREQWGSAQWQRAHTVKNLREFEEALGAHLDEALLDLDKSEDRPLAGVVVPLVTAPHRGTSAAIEAAVAKAGADVRVTEGLGPHPMLAEVLHLSQVARAVPDNRLLGFLAFHQSHVPWAWLSLRA